MKKQITQLAKRNSVKQLIKYGMVGVVGLIIELTIFYLLTKVYAVNYPFSSSITDILGGKIAPSVINTDISHIISSFIAIINNFVLNSYFTFKVTDNKVKRFVSFAGIASLGLVLSTTIITLLVGKLGMEEMLAKIIAVGIVAMIQFVINKFFTFKRKNT